MTKTVVCFGRLVPVREEILSFERGGQVEFVGATEQDVVKAGAVLARVEQTELEERRRVLQGDVDRVFAALSEAPQVETRALRQRLQQSEARLAAIETELARGVIVAPMDGRIEECRVVSGQGIAAGMTAFRIVADLPPVVQLSADTSVAAQLTDDTVVWVGVLPTARAASVVSRDPLRGPISGALIHLEFKEELSPGTWSLGDVVETRFVVSTGSSGIRVPIESLMQQVGDSWYVYVADPEVISGETQHRILRRTVRITSLRDGDAVVTGDLKPGERIVVSGTHRLVQNQSVTVVDDSEPPGLLPETGPTG